MDMAKKRIISIMLTIILVISFIPLNGLNIISSAADVSLADLKSRFPQGKYWNHYCSSQSDTSNYCRDNGIDCYVDSVSDSPCWSHSASGYSSYVGQYDCNRFHGATQCCGFAQRVTYIAYGSYCTAWSKGSLSSLKPGDVIHYYGDGAGSDWGHWVVVVSVSGTAVTVGECNWGGRCKINWSRTIYTGNLSSATVYSAPWTLPTSSTPSVTLTSDSRYPVPFKSKIISTSKVRCYNDAAKSSSPGYIYPEDDCNVTAIYTNGLLKCECPWSDGSTKTVYIDKSEFINSSMAPSSMTAPQYGVTYLRSDASTNMGWIDPGDNITKVAVSGNMTQIIYPRGDGGLRCAWVYTSVLEPPATLNWPEFVCRTISTEKVVCYNDLDYSSSPGKIYPDDDCTITAMYANGKVQCLCPWSDGSTKTVYVDRSVFIPFSPSLTQMTAPNYCLTYLRTSNTDSHWGWIDEGDTIYKLGTSGNMTQVLYPKGDGGLRCAWVFTSDITKTYTVSYNANGGQGIPGNQTKTYDVNLVLSSTIPTRTGYTFLGWSESSTATTATYGAGGIYTKNAATTLYAVWKANQYNVLYDANGGQNAPESQVKIHGVTLILSTSQPTKVGYTFSGWSTSSDATSVQYQAGGSYTANSAATLYAVWNPNTYTVSYDANGGQNAPASQTKTYGSDLIISNEIPTKTGYTFKGWAVAATPNVIEYNPGDLYFYDSDETLYAIWEANIIVTFDANGGSCDISNKSVVYNTAYGDLPMPSRTGYTFTGWYTSLAGGTKVESTTIVSAAESHTLYAIWEENVPEYVSGDINGDNVVNNKDLTRLMKYLAGEDVTVQEAALDINGDRNVNNKDLTRLMKYLAGEDVTIY